MHSDSRSTSITIMKSGFCTLIAFLNENGSDQRRVVQDIKRCLFFSLVKLPKINKCWARKQHVTYLCSILWVAEEASMAWQNAWCSSGLKLGPPSFVMLVSDSLRSHQRNKSLDEITSESHFLNEKYHCQIFGLVLNMGKTDK